MITKKNIIIATTAGLLIFILFFFINSRNKPVRISKEILLTENIEMFASEKLLKEINFNYSANRQFLEESVSNYKTERDVSKSELIYKSNNKAKVKITLIEKITNINSGFSYESENIYHIYLIYENKSWKVDNIELLAN